MTTTLRGTCVFKQFLQAPFETERRRERVYWWGFAFAIDPKSAIFIIPLLGSTAGGMTFGFETNENESEHEIPFHFPIKTKWHFSLIALTLKMRLRLGKASGRSEWPSGLQNILPLRRLLALPAEEVTVTVRQIY